MSNLSIVSGKTGSPEGNMLSRRFFASEAYHRLLGSFPVAQGEVVWDVGIPLLEQRPVLDDELIRTNPEVAKRRAHLGIMTVENTLFQVRIKNVRESSSDPTPVKLGLPLSSDAEGSLFSANNPASEAYQSLAVTLTADGLIDFMGTNETGDTRIFHGRAMNHDYERLANLIDRMAAIPTLDNTPRQSL